MLRTMLGVRAVGAGLALVAVLVGVPAAWANLAQVPVKTKPNPIRENNPAVSAKYFAWAQSSKRKPLRFNAFEQVMSSGSPTGSITRVNVAGSQGFPGGISNTRLAYQQTINGRSDIRFFDLASHTHSNPPAGVNSPSWEYEPTISPTWLMFGRSSTSRNTDRVLLWNLHTNSVSVLFSVRTHGPASLLPAN